MNIFNKYKIVCFLITSQKSQNNIQEIKKWLHFIIIIVIRPFYESRMNWVVDPAPPASRQ